MPNFPEIHNQQEFNNITQSISSDLISGKKWLNRDIKTVKKDPLIVRMMNRLLNIFSRDRYAEIRTNYVAKNLIDFCKKYQTYVDSESAARINGLLDYLKDHTKNSKNRIDYSREIDAAKQQITSLVPKSASVEKTSNGVLSLEPMEAINPGVQNKEKKPQMTLHFAAQEGKEEIVKSLLKDGALVNAAGQQGQTPLHIAAYNGQDSIVKILLENGADANIKNENGLTPIFLAISQGKVKAAKLLLEAKNATTNPTDSNGLTPLHKSATVGNKEMVQLLLDKGAELHAKDPNGNTALHLAAYFGKEDAVKILLERKAAVDARSHKDTTPLDYAVLQGQEGVVKILLEQGALANVKTVDLLNILSLALKKGHLSIAKVLLEAKNATTNQTDSNGFTFLQAAVLTGDTEIVKFLLDEGADVSVKAPKGKTLLHLAAGTGKDEMVDLLLQRGLDLNLLSDGGVTVYMQAYYLGHRNLGDKLYKASSAACQAWLAHKLLNHRFGLDINVQEGQEIVELSGFGAQITYFHLLDSIQKTKKWLEEAPASWTEQDTKNIFNAFDLALACKNSSLALENRVNKAIEAYKNKELVIVPVEYKPEEPEGPGHATAAAFLESSFAQGDRNEYLDDEGVFSFSSSNLKIYQMQNQAKLQALITSFIQEEKERKSFIKEIDQEPQLEKKSRNKKI